MNAAGDMSLDGEGTRLALVLREPAMEHIVPDVDEVCPIAQIAKHNMVLFVETFVSQVVCRCMKSVKFRHLQNLRRDFGELVGRDVQLAQRGCATHLWAEAGQLVVRDVQLFQLPKASDIARELVGKTVFREVELFQLREVKDLVRKFGDSVGCKIEDRQRLHPADFRRKAANFVV